MYDILLPSVVIRLLLRIKSSSKLASVVFRRHLQLRNETPNLSSLFMMAVPLLYFLLQRAFSLSRSLPLFCGRNVLSVLHITTEPPKLRTDILLTFGNFR
ncbi:hypothetical protein CHARACLAT_028622 [Characodon lateralis]|uniref:Uncharacterized protein n=1 Tax=Characodon lateralis TaxID=208331 RepID=A0ABU7D213_9TELE|nr:hypothetical protein [Characodon lateralis]